MKKNILAPVILLAITVGLAVLSFVVLPSSVVIQFSAGSKGNTSVPKLFAVFIPSALGIGGAAASLWMKDEYKRKGFILSIVGIALFIVMILANVL